MRYRPCPSLFHFFFGWINIVTVILVSYVHRHRLPGGRNPL